MAVQRILIYPDPFLRKPTEKVHTEDLEHPEIGGTTLLLFEKMLNDMEDTLEEVDRGAALAANQIGLPYRMFVTNQMLTQRTGMESKDHPWEPKITSIPPWIINPEILEKSKEHMPMTEGCLSFPGIQLKVKRHQWVKVSYETLSKARGFWERKTIIETYDKFWGQVFQHEIDHLDGKLFVDFLPTHKRLEIVKQIQRKK